MQHSRKNFVFGTLVGTVVGCTIVLVVWQVLPVDKLRGESERAQAEIIVCEFDEAWQTLLQTEEESLTTAEFIELLEKEKIEDLTRLVIESFDFEQDKRTQLIQASMIATMTHKSPRTALELAWKFPRNRQQELIDIVVATLSMVDLDKTLEIVRSVPESYREGALKTILASRPELSQSDWKEITDDANVSKLIAKLHRDTDAIAQFDRPSEAWDQLLSDDVENDEQKELLLQIAVARIEADGFEVLSQFYENLYLNDSVVLDFIMREVVAIEPSATLESIKGMPYESRKFILPILMEAWAAQDPKKAYFALTEIADYQQLSGDIRTLRAWSKLDPLDVLDSLTEIKRSDRNSAVETAFAELAKTNPDEIIQRLEELKKFPGVSADDLEWKLVTNWSKYEPLKAVNWIQENTDNGSRQQSRMLSLVLSDLISVDVDTAWEIALKQPIGSYFVREGLIGSLFSELVDEGFLDKAINSLDDLPEAAIYSGFSSVGDGLVEVGRWSDALMLADKLETDVLEYYLRSITITASYGSVQDLIDRLKDMPNDETRRYMAEELVRQQESRGDVLTEQQLEVVQSLLPEGDQNSELDDS